MPRFFVTTDAVDKENNIITIAGDDARHIARSLRMAVGDSVTVSDGQSTEYVCTLTRIRDEECLATIESEAAGGGEPKMDITLCMAYPKGDKLETVIQKAVELGVTKIIPFESSRCIKRPKAEKMDKLTARLSRIAEEAAKQCGRVRIPTVMAPTSFTAMLGEAVSCELALFCYECEHNRSLPDVLTGEAPSSVSIIIGAEGGFSAEEAAEAINKGAVSVSLGKRILRCETAPSFVLSAISYEYELGRRES